ncbi:MAG: dephospho-CoA kinase [Candidatus Omnitrophota bacterium]|jgi:dephospho-CoA kinase
MLVIGLTGGFCTGKSCAADVFKSLGAKVLDADSIAHQSLKKGAAGYKKIVKAFDRGILDRRGEIDRKKLAEIVFNEKKALKKLERIIHPGVIRSIKRAIREARKNDIIVIDAPLLIEAGLEKLADKLVVVKASQKNQIIRSNRKYRTKKEECLTRIRCQIPLKDKIKMADFVIDNDGTKKDTKEQIMEIWRKVWR